MRIDTKSRKEIMHTSNGKCKHDIERNQTSMHDGRAQIDIKLDLNQIAIDTHSKRLVNKTNKHGDIGVMMNTYKVLMGQMGQTDARTRQ